MMEKEKLKKIWEATYSIGLALLFYPCLVVSFRPIIKDKKINKNFFLSIEKSID